MAVPVSQKHRSELMSYMWPKSSERGVGLSWSLKLAACTRFLRCHSLEAFGLDPWRWSILDNVVSVIEESWGGVNKETCSMLLVQNTL